ncbi:MAG TPA: ABC transporter permease [Acidimicrobiales bacterium]|nr:ABC transporter permease [Acidimicrobiales bacterium]
MTTLLDRLRKPISTFGPVLAIFAVQQLFFPVPRGTFLHGVIIGLVTSMIAVGMALIYRANRVLNFAQGDLGYLPASLSVMIVVTSGVPWLLAFGAGIAVAAALGAACELLIIRRFFKAPRLVLTVATLGLSQLLAFGGLILPRLFDNKVRSQRPDPPFDFTFTFGEQVFGTNHLLVLVLAPLSMLLVGIFLQKTAVGVAIRASADRAERASLLGVPVKGLHTIVWAIAGVLAFMALFLRAGVIGLPIGQALSLGVIMRAFAAMMLGRMTNLTTIALSGVAIGVLQMGVDINGLSFLDQKNPQLIEPVVAVVAIAALLLRRKDVSRLETDGASSWSATDEVRPVPPELKRLPEVRLVQWGSISLLTVGVLMLPHWVSIDVSLKISVVFIYVLVAASIVVVTGWAGQVSLAQVAFMAVGAVAGAKATNDWNVDLTLALLFAGLVGVVAAVIVGLPALRVKGLFLAVTTLGFGLATSNWLLSPFFFDFVPTGRIERLPLFGRIDLNSPTRIYYVCLAVAIIVVAALAGIRNSRTGRVLLALRENEKGVQAYGVSIVRAKLTAFAISGFVAAVAGAMFVHHQQAYDESSYGPFLSIIMFTAAVIGGLGSLTGGVIGAIYLEAGYYLLPGNWRFFSSSVGVLFVLLVIPGGIGSVLYKLRDMWLRWVAERNQIEVPSMLADRKVESSPPPDDAIVEAAEAAAAELDAVGVEK